GLGRRRRRSRSCRPQRLPPPRRGHDRDLRQSVGPRRGERIGALCWAKRGGRRVTRLPVLELDRVVKAYPGDPPLEVLHGVSLTVFEGDLVAIVGPSGSGKSTLLPLMGTP